MISDSYSKMSSIPGSRPAFQTDYGDRLLLFVQGGRKEITDSERELNLYRSGSVPPTAEGSLTAAFGGLFGLGDLSEEDMRLDPAAVSFFYSNVNSPSLPPPPPLLSKDDCRFGQRLQRSTGGSSGIGEIGDGRKVVNREGKGGGNNRSLSSHQPEIFENKDERIVELKKTQTAAEGGGHGLIGLLPGLGPKTPRKGIAEFIQDDIIHSSSSNSRNHTRSASLNAICGIAESFDPHFGTLQHEWASMDVLGSSARPLVRNTVGESSANTYASALGTSLSRSKSTDPHHIISPIGRTSSMDKRNVSGPNSSADPVTAMSDLAVACNGIPGEVNHSRTVDHYHANQYESPHFHPRQINASRTDMNELQGPFVSSGTACMKATSNRVHNNAASISNYGLNGYFLNLSSPSLIGKQGGHLPPLSDNTIGDSVMGISGVDSRSFDSNLDLDPKLLPAASELQNRSRVGNQNASLEIALMDHPMYHRYMRLNSVMNGQMIDTDVYTNLVEVQRAYLNSFPSPTKSQYGSTYVKSANHKYYGSQSLDLDMLHLGSVLVDDHYLPNGAIGSGSPVKYGESRSQRFPYGMRNSSGGAFGTWRPEGCGNLDEHFASSLLDEFKSNKTKCFELSEIAGHVVEFSTDQYGSRFIQQKLETATFDEKNMIFHEIMPQSLSLMTDVFGNYVIQKFLDHGTSSQIRELADELTGNVLTLSLQMYGCRVIQKAVEVVDLDQKTKLVNELDGHVLQCVHDQNGNHVIQKCIERIPQEVIHFIVSVFYNEVVTLSMHPYGCRVIQRVLEHCTDFKTQRILMEEILKSVCLLANDQYGNYVVQHVLERGRPEERSAIINKLIGQIVQMSQQKFASNVVEKCLTFGMLTERQILVDEILGSTDESEPLQVMMKDQFANYVVQKVLETCDDKQLELILTKIKIHLNALKKYTYGKHIVARVEKLVAAGEKRKKGSE